MAQADKFRLVSNRGVANQLVELDGQGHQPRALLVPHRPAAMHVSKLQRP